MTGYATLFLVAGSLLISFHHLASRWGLAGMQDRGGSPLYFLSWGFGLTTAACVLMYTLIWGWTMPTGLRPGFWYAVAMSTAANMGIQFLNAKASTYKQGEASLTAPLSAMTPGLITILALTLGEIPGPAGIAGVLCMAAGSWMIVVPLKDQPKNWREYGVYLRPFKALTLAYHYKTLGPEDKGRTIVVWLSFAAAGLGTIGILHDGLYTRWGGDLQGLWLAMTTLFGALCIFYSILYSLQSSETKAASGSMFDQKFFRAVSYWALLWVLITWCTKPPYFDNFVAYVGTFYRLNILFTIVLVYVLWRMGVKVFNEENLKVRFVAGTIILTGAALIASEHLVERLTDKLQFHLPF